MARMPEAEWLGEHADTSYRMSRYDVVCLHTIVGNPPAHAAHFSTRSDGRVYQSRDTLYQSAANYNGNYRVIAIENDDTGDPFPNWDHNDGRQVPGFTDAQMWGIAKVLVWCNRTHGVPLVACPDSKPTSKGIAYHRQGIDGNFASAGYRYGGRVPGGEVWTKYPGKACPGDRRIDQVPEIIKRARQLAGLEPKPAKKEEDHMYFLKGGTGLSDCDIYLQTGPFFIGLTPGARTDAVAAIQERGAPFQWVTQVEVDDFDRRSHALFDKGSIFDLMKEHSSLLRDVATKLGEMAPPAS